MTGDEAEYLLGTQLPERLRLGFQHRVWLGHCREHWATAGFGPGDRLLDVGCGPGFATVDLAYLVGETGSVHAIDRSPRFVGWLDETARQQGLEHVTTQVAEIDQSELPAESFDGAYARWFLCFVDDPVAAVGRVATALRPGGSFSILDYGHYETLSLTPRGPAFDRVIRAVVESWSASGGDLDVALRLPAILDAAGFDLVDQTPVIEVTRPGELFWQWPQHFFRGYVPQLIEGGFLTEAEGEAFFAEWQERDADPAAFFLTPPMLSITARKR